MMINISRLTGSRYFLPIGIVAVAAVCLLLLGVLASVKATQPPSRRDAGGDFQVDSFDDFKKLAMVLKNSDEGERAELMARLKALEGKISEMEKAAMDRDSTISALLEMGSRAKQEQHEETDIPASQRPSSDTGARTTLQVLALGGKSGGKITHIPAGTFAKATLLTGVYAPIRSDAMPVLLRVDALGIGPNRSLVPIDGVFVVAKAVGDANSTRAIIQLETLSLVRKGGHAIEKNVNGFVVDYDGIQGLRGQYVYRLGEVGTLAIVSGGLAAGAEAVSKKHVTPVPIANVGVEDSVTGDPVDYAAAKSVSGALTKISDIFEKRVDEIIPAVYVPNAKPVHIVFISGVTLDSLSLKEVNYETKHPRKELGGYR